MTGLIAMMEAEAEGKILAWLDEDVPKQVVDLREMQMLPVPEDQVSDLQGNVASWLDKSRVEMWKQIETSPSFRWGYATAVAGLACRPGGVVIFGKTYDYSEK